VHFKLGVNYIKIKVQKYSSILLHDIGRIKQEKFYELFRETNKDHARRSRDWIIENGESEGLDIVYINPIAWICWGHGDVEGAENEIRHTFNNCMVPIENEEVDMLFLISLLRLGDVLDIGFKRIPKHVIDSLWKIPDSEIKYILKDYLTNGVIINTYGKTGKIIKITVRKPSNIDNALFSDIETNLIKNKCEEVLNSVMEHLNRRDIFFRPIDVQIIEARPEKIIERLVRKEITKETYTEMTEEYERARLLKPIKVITISQKHEDEIREPVNISDEVSNSGGKTILISKNKANRTEVI
jgi:NADH:ubiquinone oxidoreductase subunit